MLLLAGLLAPRAAAALDVKLWPLFRYARDEARGEVRWSALGPLIEFRSTRESRDLYVRPILWLRQQRGARRADRADIFYPLAASGWQGDEQSFRFLLFTYRAKPAPADTAAPGTSRFTLFPLVFFRRSPDTGTHLSVLPFYFDEPDFLGYQRMQAVMFPAYLKLTEPRIERRFFGFPFVSTLGGPDGRGTRVWPFYGTKEIRGRERTRYVLWPFYIRSERLVPGYGWERRRIDFPVYAAIEGAGVESHAWGIGAYVHTVDTRRGMESIGSPWPLAVRQRHPGETAWRTWRLAPLYGRRDLDGFSSRFYAWPAYRWRTQDTDDFHYQRRDAGLVLWRNQTLRNDRSGRHERLLTVFPVLRAEQQGERRFGQVPALVDSVLPSVRGVRRLWAPLYALFRWDTRPDGSRDWNLLWGLLAREDGRLIGPWHVDLHRAGEGTDGD